MIKLLFRRSDCSKGHSLLYQAGGTEYLRIPAKREARQVGVFIRSLSPLRKFQKRIYQEISAFRCYSICMLLDLSQYNNRLSHISDIPICSLTGSTAFKAATIPSVSEASAISTVFAPAFTDNIGKIITADNMMNMIFSF